MAMERGHQKAHYLFVDLDKRILQLDADLRIKAQEVLFLITASLRAPAQTSAL